MPTYSTSWTPSAPGSYTISAVATNTQGLSQTANVNVTVTSSGSGGSGSPGGSTTVPLRLSDSSPTSKGSLGIGLNSVNDFSGSLQLLNIGKQARRHVTSTDSVFDTNEYEKIDTDTNGWPKSLVPKSTASFTQLKLILTAKSTNMPAGRYVVRWTGNATWNWFGATLVESDIPNRKQVITVPEDTGAVWLNFTVIDPGNYFRDLIVIRESQEALYDSGEIFNPDYLQILQKFQTLRFMDWQQTNYSPLDTWASRPTVNHYSWATNKGVPLEVQVALCNKLGADGWFNIPHMADDNYVTQFATYLKANLNAPLKAYVEYSNEIWNPIFSQGLWMDIPAQQKYANISEPPFTKRLNWFGWRTDVIGGICKSVFGAEANRIICTLGCQAANTYGGDQGYKTPLEGSPRTNIDAIAIAPYFNAGGEIGRNDEPYKSAVSSWTVDQLFQELNEGGVLPAGSNYPQGCLAQSKFWTQAYKNLCNEIGKPLIAYEGGQHLVDYTNTEVVQNLLRDANRHPKMYDAYIKYFSDWKEVGGELFCHFVDSGTWSKFGYWGALESVAEYNPGTAKYNALYNFMIQNPQWW